MSVASSGSEGRRRAELELDELERRRHSARHVLPAALRPAAHAHRENPAQHRDQENETEMAVMDQTGAAVASAQNEKGNPVGLYGWRKRCLYFFVLLLVVVIITNLALTIWLLVVLNFSLHGMGSLRILDSGIRLEGTAEFLGPLYTRNISADQNSSLLLQSTTAIDLSIEGGADVVMDTSSVNITAQQFQVSSPTNSNPSLSISDDVITVGAAQMEVKGTLGVVLNGPLETQQISSHPNADLSIESSSGSLVITGTEGVQIEDGTAFEGVEITSNERLTISSHSEVLLDSETVRLGGLPVAGPNSNGQGQVFEVCACASGKLFLVPASADGPVCSSQAAGDVCSTSTTQN